MNIEERRNKEEEFKGEHLTFAVKLEIGVLRQEAGGRRQEERGRRKEEEGNRKKEGARRSVFTNMRCSQFKVLFNSLFTASLG